jgi:hypothetical protein
VAIEVVCGTALLGWAMLSLPNVMGKQWALSRDEITTVLVRGKRHAAVHRRTIWKRVSRSSVRTDFGWVVGIVFLLLLERS